MTDERMRKNMAGEWQYANMPPCALPQDAATAFSKVKITGVKYVPVLYVGSQLVAGKNYCIVCSSTSVTNPPEPGCKTLFIYEDLDGNCSITKIEDIIS